MFVFVGDARFDYWCPDVVHPFGQWVMPAKVGGFSVEIGDGEGGVGAAGDVPEKGVGEV